MFKHLHIKIFSLLLAIVFWIFVVSLENNFVELPNAVPVEVFNLAPDLAIATKLGEVRLTVRSSDQ